MKLNIYILHSEKIDYKNEIYKPLLELGLMKDYYLILPLSNKYKSDYIKDLLKTSDVVICNLSKFNLLSKFELKTAIKFDKLIYYFIDSSDKKIKQHKEENIITYNDKKDFANKVKTILDSLNKKDLILKRDNIYTLGKVDNKDNID